MSNDPTNSRQGRIFRMNKSKRLGRPQRSQRSVHWRHFIGVIGWTIALGAITTVAYGEDVKTVKDCRTCPEMVVIPGGSFVMGVEKEEATGEGTGRQVRLVCRSGIPEIGGSLALSRRRSMPPKEP